MATEPLAAFGPYRIGVLLGRGGMGAVYEAVDDRLGRTVALKILTPGLDALPAFRERFMAESRAAASLDQANIIPVYEAGEHDGRLFIAMRLVPGGRDLDKLLRASGPLAQARAVSLIAQVASALDAAHQTGLIHRDVKPGNILVASDGARDQAYLSDFGLARQRMYAGGLTRTGELVGTVDYLAPEVIEGLGFDHRVDIYALGCVLYECLVGVPPFRRETDVASLYAHVHAPVPSPHQRSTDVTPAFDAVIARALAKDPDKRYASAGAMASDAQAALLVMPRLVAAGSHESPPKTGTNSVRDRSRKRWTVAAVGIALLSTGLGALVLLDRGAAQPPDAPSSMSGSMPAVVTESSSMAPAVVERIVFSREFESAGTPACAPTAGAVEAHLYSVAPDGSAETILPLTLDYSLHAPAWSHDGSRIAVSVGAYGELQVVDLVDGDLDRIGFEEAGTGRDGEVADNSWSPDDQMIVSPSRGAGATVYNRRTGEGWPLLQGASYMIDMGPQPDRPAFLRQQTRYPTSSNVGAPKPPREPPTSAVAYDWAPDGRIGAAVLVSTRGGSSGDPIVAATEIWTMDAAGEDLQLLTTLDGLEVRYLDWSSDGSRIAIEATDPTKSLDGAPDASSDSSPGDIHLLELASGAVLPLTDSPADEIHPSWSPDASRLAYASDRSGNYDIYVSSSSGQPDETRITRSREGENSCDPSWGATALADALVPPAPGPFNRFHLGRLGVGTFEDVDFEPVVRFTLDGDWDGTVRAPDLISARLRADPLVEVSVATARTAFSDPCVPEGQDLETDVLDDDPASVIAWLRSRPELRLSAVHPETIGGYPALGLDVVPAKSLEELCDGMPVGEKLHLFLLTSDSLGIRAGQTIRIWVIDAPSGTLVVSSGEPSVNGRFAAYGQAMDVVQSLSFGEKPEATDS